MRRKRSVAKELPVEIGNWIATRQENGTFLYKAKNEISLSKRPSALALKEKSLYFVIEQCQNVAKLRYKEELSDTVKRIVTFLKNM